MSIGPSVAGGLLRERATCGDVHDIDRAMQRAPAKRADFASRLLRLCTIVQMAERDVGALGCERERGGAADATRSAGDQRHLTLQFHLAFSSVSGVMLHRGGFSTKVPGGRHVT